MRVGGFSFLRGSMKSSVTCGKELELDRLVAGVNFILNSLDTRMQTTVFAQPLERKYPQALIYLLNCFHSYLCKLISLFT